MVSRCDWNAALAGLRLDAVAVTRGKSNSVEDWADTALWLVENGDCGGIYFAISEDDIQRVLRHPASMIASDGQVVMFGRASPHPRSYGTFSRVLGRYVRELKVLALEDAIRKMSSHPAQRIGLADPGISCRNEGRHRSRSETSAICRPRAASPIRSRCVDCRDQWTSRVRERNDDAARPGRVLHGLAYAR
jgi:dihydroorotase/N-acyl-D-amino-acid deacylase